MNYFLHPFVSNSDLTKLWLEINAVDERDLNEAFRFGTLVHALILEPHKVDLIRLQVEGETYTREEIDLARKMKIAFNNDALCRQLLSQSEFEVEMYNEATLFEHEGFSFLLDTRRKYDGWIASANWGWDLKSTACTSQAQFEASIRQFDYERARVFYAKGSGAIQDVIIGVSKINFKIFKVFMKHGDQLWQEGERKCCELAFKYWSLKAITV
jgi:hypothetical protein